MICVTAGIPKVVGSIPTVASHIFQAFPVWIYTQINITQASYSPEYITPTQQISNLINSKKIQIQSISFSHDDEYPPFLCGIQFLLTNADNLIKQCEKQFFQNKLTIYRANLPSFMPPKMAA